MTQFVKKRDFILCFINNVMTVGTGVMICGLYQSHGFSLGFKVSEMALVGLIGAINNGWSRVFIGWFADKYSYKISKLLILFVHMTSFIILLVGQENVYA